MFRPQIEEGSRERSWEESALWLACSRSVAALIGCTQKLGGVANWLVLLARLISAGNAFSRYLFSVSSNAQLEIQCAAVSNCSARPLGGGARRKPFCSSKGLETAGS